MFTLYLISKMNIKAYYNTILAQTYSPCGNYLVTGDTYGEISVINLQELVYPDQSVLKTQPKPKKVFKVDDVQINSLQTTTNHLIVGTHGKITGYSWQLVTTDTEVKSAWSIEVGNNKDAFARTDINSLCYDEENDLLYACSDNIVYKIHLETRKILDTFDEHSDYIHSIVCQGNDLLSGGEDGVVNVWDIRSKSVVHKLEPCKNDVLKRDHLGKWIGAIAMNDDWLLCGGGPRLALWHFRSFTLSTVFPVDLDDIHVALFSKDGVHAGGRGEHFYSMSFNGDITSTIATSSSTIYSAAIQEKPFKAMCLAGSSAHIDICTNFIYKDQVFTLG